MSTTAIAISVVVVIAVAVGVVYAWLHFRRKGANVGMHQSGLGHSDVELGTSKPLPPLPTGLLQRSVSLLQTKAPRAGPKGLSYVVRQSYSSRAPDELDLSVGDAVKVTQTFDDGWAVGLVAKSGRRGVFPLVVFNEPGDSSPTYLLTPTATATATATTTPGNGTIAATSATTTTSTSNTTNSTTPASSATGTAPNTAPASPTSTASSAPIVPIVVSASALTKDPTEVPYERPQLHSFKKRVSSVGSAHLLPQEIKDLPGLKRFYGTTGVVMRVVHPYTPTNPEIQDELTIVAGQDLIMLAEFEDGWGMGMLPLTGQKGAFPMPCVARYEDISPASNTPSLY
ncbi:hypothetical protein HDU99_000867 [Rhizoclosmatium hyalinum]|nr:hypothetical protein HDU99_000867 [Rhizoclosmatium hyalinum]